MHQVESFMTTINHAGKKVIQQESRMVVRTLHYSFMCLGRSFVGAWSRVGNRDKGWTHRHAIHGLETTQWVS